MTQVTIPTSAIPFDLVSSRVQLETDARNRVSPDADAHNSSPAVLRPPIPSNHERASISSDGKRLRLRACTAFSLYDVVLQVIVVAGK